MKCGSAFLTTIIVLALAGIAAAQSSQRSPLILVQGPRIIAFFSLDPRDSGVGDNEALSDFQFYAGKVRAPLKKDGIEFNEVYAKSFRVRVGTRTTLFHPDKVTVGYYFAAPGKRPHIEYGVMTDLDLLEVARQYFGTGEGQKQQALH